MAKRRKRRRYDAKRGRPAVHFGSIAAHGRARGPDVTREQHNRRPAKHDTNVYAPALFGGMSS